jgi:hypothetical protein
MFGRQVERMFLSQALPPAWNWNNALILEADARKRVAPDWRRLMREKIAPGGNMTPSEFRAAVEVARLSASDIQELLGVDEQTRRRLATGEQPVPRCVALCLWLMAAYGVSILEARVLADDPSVARPA